MSVPADQLPVGIEVCACLTPLGDAAGTTAALLDGRRALEFAPVLGRDGGDAVPLALLGPMDETLPPRWLPALRRLVATIPAGAWGGAREPVIVTSSNFGVGSLYAFTRDRDSQHLAHGTPYAAVELLRSEFGWGEQVQIFSHACVTAHLGLAQAARMLHAGTADRVLVFSFDFVSPFVAGGFHSLKILNGEMPAPYTMRATGSIGLGDGAAFAVLTREPAPFQLRAHALHNEMFHFTSNQPDGTGFVACAAAIAAAAGGRRVWVKGHGTGTLEAGRLEAEVLARQFPGAPLTGWKGSLGHTLGSCGLVELAIAMDAFGGGRIPGTVGGAAPSFTETVALEPFASDKFDGAILTSNAFGGAHAAMLLTHD
jgi:3-oxoacyl-(acyl-carrier-protein) synthase